MGGGGPGVDEEHGDGLTEHTTGLGHGPSGTGDHVVGACLGLHAQDTVAVAYHGVEVGDGSFGSVRVDDLPGTKDLCVFVPTQVAAQVGHHTSFGDHSATYRVGHVGVSGHQILTAVLDVQADGFGVTIIHQVSDM